MYEAVSTVVNNVGFSSFGAMTEGRIQARGGVSQGRAHLLEMTKCCAQLLKVSLTGITLDSSSCAYRRHNSITLKTTKPETHTTEKCRRPDTDVRSQPSTRLSPSMQPCNVPTDEKNGTFETTDNTTTTWKLTTPQTRKQ